MITPDYLRIMARYNRWQNRSLVAAADTLNDAARWQDRGPVFGSIAQTLNHILWDDRAWLARLNEQPDAAADISARHPYTDAPRDWAIYKHDRAAVDADILHWAAALTGDDLARDIAWMRGDVPMHTPLGFNIVHMINHQTHHRGQVHAMLTMAGATPDPTDLQMLDTFDT